jgi:hypothetical protein
LTVEELAKDLTEGMTMRMKLYRWTVAAVVAGMALSVAAKAQSAEASCSPGSSVSGGSGVLAGVAYSAIAKTTFEQRLPDGNTIRGFIRTHMARDGAGKTMSEMGQGCARNENGVPEAQLYVNVFDPAAKTMMTWSVGSIVMPEVVQVLHVSTTPRKPLTPEELAAQGKASQRWLPLKSEFKTEDLGSRTIAGVEAHGSRMTRTIPPGEEGNELQLVTTTETWRSKKLGMTLSVITDDPRHGKTTYELEELVQGEPDPSVFAPPAGYKIKDITPPVETASTNR